ncbi:MAG TPA: MarR family transcriptional regulator [Pilimelia sp.]|nr:MarR family transcriptional regulator [Pilimelia sp.]
MAAAPGIPDEQVIHYLLDRVSVLCERTRTAMTSTLRDLRLTPATANLLWLLAEDGTPPSMSELAAALGCDPSTVTFTVTRLETLGLVLREASPHDRRAKVVALTADGMQVRRKLVDAVAVRSPLTRLTPAEQRQLCRLIDKATR